MCPMSNAVPTRPRPATLEDYFEAERSSPLRHEFRGGKIVAMAGGSIEHGTITSNVGREVGKRLEDRPCRAFGEGQRIKAKSLGQFMYADGSALCGPVEVSRDDGVDSITNPQLVVEVLSPTSQKDDRDAKFDAYSTIESVTEYALIEQTEPRVTLLRRRPGGPWVFANVVGLDGIVTFESIGIEVPMRALYRDVEFAQVGVTAP